MKEERLLKKSCAFGIILVFIGACIIPSIAESASIHSDTTSMTKMMTKVSAIKSPKNPLTPTATPSKITRLDGLYNWTEQAKLLASDGASEDFFTSLGLSLSGDTALIGAWGDDDNGADSGSVYVFTRTGIEWTEQAKLLASDEAAGDAFGWCTAIQDDTAFIGAVGDDNSKGSVYVFTRMGTTWTEQAKLVAADGAAGDQFGYNIYISGDTVVIGANCDDDKGFDSGSAYVYIRTGTTWTQQAKLLPSDGESLDSFGGEVSISGDTALIGSCFDDDNGLDSGSAYVYIRVGTSWTEQAKLLASDGAEMDFFSAYAVSISDDTALIGAPGDDSARGSAYVFIRTDTTWTEQTKLLSNDGATGDSFGGSVFLSEDIALIGAGGDDDNGHDSGSVYEFIRTDTTWNQVSKLLASDGSTGDVFGWDVALDDDTILIGAYYDDDNGADSGSAYVFVKESENQPPSSPTITGPAKGKINVETKYNFSATDPDNNDMYYFIDWGDHTNTSWIGPYQSGNLTTKSHTWSKKGTYTIKAKTKDTAGAESDWETFSISMPYKPQQFPLLEWLMQRFPHAFPLLRHLMGY